MYIVVDGGQKAVERIQNKQKRTEKSHLADFTVLPQASPGVIKQSDCYLKSEFLVL